MRDDIKEAMEIIETLVDLLGNTKEIQAIETIITHIAELEEEIDYLLDDVVIVSLDIDRGNVA